MSTKPQWLLRLALLVALAVWANCVTIQEGVKCAAQGLVAQGGICAPLQATGGFTISTTELVDLLNAQAFDRTCIQKGNLPVCADDQAHGVLAVLPKRGASIIIPPDVWETLTTELNDACRELGSRCSFAVPDPVAQLRQ